MKETAGCIGMKRRAAEEAQQLLANMTLEEELAYWQRGTEELQQRQKELRLLRQIEALPSPGPATSTKADATRT